MARLSARSAARKNAPARPKRIRPTPAIKAARAAMKRHGIAEKDASAAPLAEAPRRTPLARLGLGSVDGGWSTDRLDGLSVGELLAIVFDTGDADPAFSLMRHVSTDLTALPLAYADKDAAMRREDVIAVLHRLSMAALVAGELHRRELRLAEAGA